MESYTVSARKYRPTKFKEVVGQQHVTRTLKSAIEKEHLGHAFLFCGPRGVGKTTCARILAKTINCTNLTPEGEACGECESCKAFQQQQSFNVYELDAASNNSVDDIRRLVEQVRYAPQSGQYKTYIIDEVHMLSQAAFNAFLKTLEEPPSYAKFILATTERHKILPTILSRCQVFDFHRISIKEIVEQLKGVVEQEGLQAEEEALHVVAQKADGAMRDALSLFDRIASSSGQTVTYQDVIENLNILDYDYYFRLTEMLNSGNIAETLVTFNEIHDRGFDLHNFLVGLSEHFRNLLVCKHEATHKLLDLPESASERYVQQANKFPLSFILTAMNILNQFEQQLRASKNQRLHVELALLKLCHIPQAVKLAEELRSPDSKKKVVEAPAPEQQQEEATEQQASEEKAKEETTAESAQQQVAEPEPEPEPQQEAPKDPEFTPASAPPEPEDQPKPEATQPPRRKKKVLMGGNGIPTRDMLRQKRQEQKKEEEERQAEEEATRKHETRQEPIDVDFKAAVAVMKKYADEQLEKKSLTPVLKETEPIIKKNVVLLTVPNSALEELVRQERQRLGEYLQQELKNPTVAIDVQVVKPSDKETRRYLVNDRDIYQRMREVNPDIDQLRDELGLNLGY